MAGQASTYHLLRIKVCRALFEPGGGKYSLIWTVEVCAVPNSGPKGRIFQPFWS